MADPAVRLVRRHIAEIVEELPPEKAAQVLEFARFVRQQMTGEREMSEMPALVTVSAAQLEGLVGLVALGGDAVADAERYDE